MQKRKTRTSTAVKNRYNAKTYEMISVRVRKDKAEAFKVRCAEAGIPQAQVVKKAIEEFLGQKEEEKKMKKSTIITIAAIYTRGECDPVAITEGWNPAAARAYILSDIRHEYGSHAPYAISKGLQADDDTIEYYPIHAIEYDVNEDPDDVADELSLTDYTTIQMGERRFITSDEIDKDDIIGEGYAITFGEIRKFHTWDGVEKALAAERKEIARLADEDRK